MVVFPGQCDQYGRVQFIILLPLSPAVPVIHLEKSHFSIKLLLSAVVAINEVKGMKLNGTRTA